MGHRIGTKQANMARQAAIVADSPRTLASCVRGIVTLIGKKSDATVMANQGECRVTKSRHLRDECNIIGYVCPLIPKQLRHQRSKTMPAFAASTTHKLVYKQSSAVDNRPGNH